MTRFAEIMETVLKWEGGYSNHPADKGGPTKYGITHKTLAAWRGVATVTPRDVEQLGIDEAIDIFRNRYWTKLSMERLAAPIDLIIMDGAVNHGVPTMVNLLQTLLGVGQTGTMNDETLTVLGVQTASQASLIDIAVKIAEARKARYLGHPDARHFIRGWRNRLNDVMAVALHPYGESWTFGEGRKAGAPVVSIQAPTITSIPQSAIEDDELQAALVGWKLYDGDIDGLFGPKSVTALDKLLSQQSRSIAAGWETWPLARRKIALGQMICRDLDIDVGTVDGLFGSRTQAAFEEFNRILSGMPADAWRDELDALPVFSPVAATNTTWPTEADVGSVFGTHCEIPMKRLHLPFKMRIAWDLTQQIDGFQIHEKVHASAARVFDRIHAEYGDDGIEDLGINLFGGCYNCRKKKGGTSWSMHSWAIAIDFDPARNQLKWSHKQARLARPDAEKFWKLWEEEGWVSLGRSKDFGWMHVQAARV